MTDSHNQRRDIEQAMESSYTVDLLRSVGRPMTAIAQWFIEATRRSFLYRWLTKEPDLEIIVIDLRDSYAVRPVIRIIDWLDRASSPTVDSLNLAWQHSLLYRMGDWVAGCIEAGLETRVGEAFLGLYEPPDQAEEEQ